MNFGEFIERVLGDAGDSKVRWIYRGQANPDWGLVSSYGRFWTGVLQKRAGDFELGPYRSMLNRFVRDASILHEKDYENFTPIQRMALGQHHGIPSPVLDWSYSPFVASYFGIPEPLAGSADARVHRPSMQVVSLAVHALGIPKDESRMECEVRGLEQGKELLDGTGEAFQFLDMNPYFSRRLAHQSGCLTYQRFATCLKEWLDTREEHQPYEYRKHVIQGTRHELLDRLALMGITGGTLFDNLDYVARDSIDAEVRHGV